MEFGFFLCLIIQSNVILMGNEKSLNIFIGFSSADTSQTQTFSLSFECNKIAQSSSNDFKIFILEKQLK